MRVRRKWWVWAILGALLLTIPWPKSNGPEQPILWSRSEGKAWPETSANGFKVAQALLDSGLMAQYTSSGSNLPGVRGANLVIQGWGPKQLVTNTARILGGKLSSLPHVQHIEVNPPGTMPKEGSPLPDYQIFIYAEEKLLGWSPIHAKTRYTMAIIHGTRLIGIEGTGLTEIHGRIDLEMNRRRYGLEKGNVVDLEIAGQAAETIFGSINEWNELATEQGLMPSLPASAMAPHLPMPTLPIWQAASPDLLNAYTTVTGSHHVVYLLNTEDEADVLFGRVEKSLEGWGREFRLQGNVAQARMRLRKDRSCLEIQHLQGNHWLVQYESMETPEALTARLRALPLEDREHPFIQWLLEKYASEHAISK